LRICAPALTWAPPPPPPPPTSHCSTRYANWREEEIETLSAKYPTLRTVLHAEGALEFILSNMVRGRFHWMSEGFTVRGALFAEAHLKLVTRGYRDSTGRVKFLVTNSSPRQSQIELDMFMCAVIMAIHEGLLCTLSAAAKPAPLDWQNPDTARGELYKFARTTEGVWDRRPTNISDQSADANQVVDRVISTLNDKLEAADLLAWAAYRATEFPCVASVYLDFRTSEGALVMSDSEKLMSETSRDDGAALFAAGQVIVLLLCAATNAWKYVDLGLAELWDFFTASSARRWVMQHVLHVRPAGRHGTLIFWDRAMEWSVCALSIATLD
jgi:hypothetical protein